MQTLSPEVIAAVLAGLLSLLATYVPGFRTKFAALTPDLKMSIMGVLTILIAVSIYFLACAPGTGFTFVACPTGGIWELAATILLALTVNTSVDRASPEPADVKAVKAAQKAANAAAS